MENKDRLKEVFEKYLDNRCSAAEVKWLLQHFGKEDPGYLRQLVEDQLERSVRQGAEEQPQLQARLREIYHSVLAQVQPEDATIVRPMRRSLFLRVAAAAAFILASGLYLYRLAGPAVPVTYELTITGSGERRILELADGTKIWLSPASRLEYPREFQGNTREVTLEGEAFFEVAPDKEHPFIIHSGPVNTKVLGTSFNIEAYKAQPGIAVTVLSGQVEVAAGRESGKVSLLPRQRAVYSLEQRVLEKEDYPDAGKLLTEREGIFRFQGTPLAFILEELQRQYGVRIRTEGDISNCTFYGSLDTRDAVTDFLEKICLALNAGWEKDGEVFVIKAGKC